MSLTIADSKAVFQRKLKEFGLDHKKKEFEDAGYTTHAELAYAFNYVPGSSDDSGFQGLCNQLLGAVTATNTQVKKPALRRLHFESYTIAIHHVQQQLSKPDDEHRPAKIPAPERAARFEAIKAKYVGVNFDGEFEPSNTLIDKVHAMRSAGEIRFLKWEELTKRESEICNHRTESHLKTEVATGYLKSETRTVEDSADISSLLHLQNALKRRGTAFEVAGILNISVHDKLITDYFTALEDDPIDEDHRRVSVQQIHVTLGYHSIRN